MLVSMKYKFVLLAMPKCGSTALHAAFGRYAELKMSGSPGLKHTPFKAFENFILPLIAEQYRNPPVCEPFSLFREPLDWLFSWYSYRGRPGLATSGDRAVKSYTGEVSFADFLHEHFKKKPAPFARIRPQSFYIESDAGDFDSVTLFRYPDLDFLVREIEGKIGKSVSLAQKNVSPKRPMELTDGEKAEARVNLKTEYQIYDSIVRRTPEV